MSVDTLVPLFQTKNAAITGVKTAPEKRPAALNTADMPIALTRPGDATWTRQAVGLSRQEREYIIEVFVKPLAQGEGVDEGFQAALPLIDAFGAYYIDDTTPGLLSVDHIPQVTDTGVVKLTMAGTDYVGFVFRVTVVEKTT